KMAMESPDRSAAAEATLLDIMLRQKRDEVSQPDALRELEALAVMWRGDAVEVKVLQLMAGIYAETGRYGESLAAAKTATRLATVYLANRKPDRAIAALRTTRIADLSGELRQQRLLLEARAQSDIGRHDLGLDIISNIVGREAIRLRSDIYWAARRWREASEQIELYYAERWRDFRPLNPAEKSDIVRA